MSGVEGKVVAITGASSGIGEATARYLAGHGAAVVLGARRDDRLKALAAELERDGGKAEAMAVDVTKRTDLAAFVKRAQERFGRLDVLVSNAGLMPLSLLDELKVDEWDRMIDVNIRGVLHGIAAVRAISEGLRQEAGSKIRVTMISPGAVQTELAKTISNPDLKKRVEAFQAIAIPPLAIARAIAFAIEQPSDVDVNEIVVRPTAQSA